MNDKFSLLQEQHLSEVGGIARLWQHKNTGAQVLSIGNSDENKCFGVAFRTPPTDSTGVAHILEHSVLCGSDKYPVKEPFVELLKGSLQTFLNAFTFPDKTCYPVASANLQDFYNLIDVYVDAVFHPRISKDIFKQEGWHIEADSPDGPWSYKGVVYNEMKGVYSSADSRLAEASQHAVFPDMLYNLDSGGNPACIPDLTYEAFRDFHNKYYHPSNSRFFFWGDDPENKRLEIVAQALEGYEAKALDSTIPLQKKLTSPVRQELPYPATEEENRSLFTVNWLLPERGNVKAALLMEMLEHILEGLPGSPLRRALIDSGLGEDMVGCGLETDLRQMYYSTGLKGIAASDIAKAEQIVLETLGKLVHNGIPREAVEAAVNSVEFAYRENNSGRFPRGLAAMIQALATWLYDGDPLSALAWEQPLAEIKEALKRGEAIFEQAIETFFLNNPHRATVILTPDATMEAKQDEEEKTRLHKEQEKADGAARQLLVDETARLQAAQLAPDSPEALATIPALGLEDLPRSNTPIPIVEERLGDHVFLAHELPTQGIAYVHLLFPLEGVPDKLVPLLPLFTRTITEVGTAKRDFVALGSLMAAKTGGIGAMPMSVSVLGSRECKNWLCVDGKVVYDKMDDLVAILQEVLLEPQREVAILGSRLQQMLLEARARKEHGLQTSGNATVSLRLASRYTSAAAFGERTGGFSSLESVRSLLSQLQQNPQELLNDLELLRQTIITGTGLIVDCTAEEQGITCAKKALSPLLQALPAGLASPKVDIAPITDLPAAEAIITPSQVNYVGKAVNLYNTGWTFHGSAAVIMRALRMGYLWEHVRVRGGAYGAGCSLDRASGTLVCTSYRDPNIRETLSSYDGMGKYLRTMSPDRAQLTQAIVGAVGDLDTYLLPDAKGARSLMRWLIHDTEEMRQQLREEMLGTTARDFVAFGEVMEQLAQGDVCVVGGAACEAVAKEQNWAICRLQQGN